MIRTKSANPDLFKAMARLGRLGLRLKSHSAGYYSIRPSTGLGQSYRCETLAQALTLGKAVAAATKAMKGGNT